MLGASAVPEPWRPIVGLAIWNSATPPEVFAVLAWLAMTSIAPSEGPVTVVALTSVGDAGSISPR